LLLEHLTNNISVLAQRPYSPDLISDYYLPAMKNESHFEVTQMPAITNDKRSHDSGTYEVSHRKMSIKILPAGKNV
jgi:hypothetical protein